MDSEVGDLDTTSENFPDFGILRAKIYSRIRIPLLLFRTEVPFICHHHQLINGLPVAQSKNELRLCRKFDKIADGYPTRLAFPVPPAGEE